MTGPDRVALCCLLAAVSLGGCGKPAPPKAPVDTTLPSPASAAEAPATSASADAAAPIDDAGPLAGSDGGEPSDSPGASDQQQEPDPPAPLRPASIITQPEWIRRPSAEDVARYYPDRAQRLEAEGSATLSCTVTAQGSLDGCAVMSESPSDMGFGDAALKLSKLFKMQRLTRDGQRAEGGEVRVPIRFTLPAG